MNGQHVHVNGSRPPPAIALTADEKLALVRKAAREWDMRCDCTCPSCIAFAELLLKHLGKEP